MSNLAKTYCLVEAFCIINTVFQAIESDGFIGVALPVHHALVVNVAVQKVEVIARCCKVLSKLVVQVTKNDGPSIRRLVIFAVAWLVQEP